MYPDFSVFSMTVFISCSDVEMLIPKYIWRKSLFIVKKTLWTLLFQLYDSSPDIQDLLPYIPFF